MDIDFPLILVMLVFGSGLIWLFDYLLLAPRRARSLSELQRSYPEREASSSSQQQEYQQRAGQIEREPLLVEYAKSFFPVLFVVFVLRSFLVEPFQIPSSSMVPTLQVGDYILVNKFTYGIRLPVVRTKVMALNEPQRGDVMVFFPPHMNDTYFIKRVIGLPGDEIRYENKRLFVNGEEIQQKLLAQLPPSRPRFRLIEESLRGVEHEIRTDMARANDNFAVTVREGHYFMMGDNRDNSSDSRVWGQVPEGDIVGKAFAIWMHWDSFLSLPSFSRVGAIQ
ncbi:signal peptidase I [Halieaceae bacterium IMCC14734]|uniref:Signal peptidase I n=1 Tax=Candidatus Litorirhabdus singularis TaxID=2518993 RepID=A0ABT3TIL0_9GAMM|nr:signal peptidase I [Candidatus Litorirhabdus singularis]MCX2981844.1 signal peptidase I [Candidatus Litorirhabdus singularis]